MSDTLLFIGVMSGSSLDGIDVALTEFSCPSKSPVNRFDTQHCNVIATHFQPYPLEVKDALLSLHFPQENELEMAALMANQLAHLYADAVNGLLSNNSTNADEVTAIGCHGQTIRHQPRFNNNIGYTIQLGNNALLAELTNITVVGDFRSRDIAANGQGAPLVPAFHQAIFAKNKKNRAIINIGGIANISYLSSTGEVIGFDTGPGNILLDHWVKLKLGKNYDADGSWSNTGSVHAKALEAMLKEPYLSLPPPKSTGRDLFNDTWLMQHLSGFDLSNQDIARTLVELTAATIYQHLIQYCPKVDEVYICGGGVHNKLLITSLKQRLGNTLMLSTNELGVDADWVEAAAFAWLAKQTVTNKPSNLPAATGADGLRILGAIYPA